MAIYLVVVFNILFFVCFTLVSGSPSTIPTKAEQINLLTNVQEVFDQLKILIQEESKLTDESTVNDVKAIVERAQDKLSLINELTLIQLSCTSNSVCMLESKPVIQGLIEDGIKALNNCIRYSSDNITSNSRSTSNVTESAIERGENLLNSFYKCSSKAGLHVISCYKGVIDKDVLPTKDKLLTAIKVHREGHQKALSIRNEANECVDAILQACQSKVRKAFGEALLCS